VIAVAIAGVGINAFSARMTMAANGEPRGMALRSVFLHVCSDLIGSFGVLLAGVIVYFTKWHQADSVVSILIGVLVLWSSWGLIREGIDILMESVPRSLDVAELRNDLLLIAGTEEIHDLHVWCLTSREFAMSAHAVIAADADHDRVLADIAALLRDKFNIHHITVQLERDSRRLHEPAHF
jgi:cobalt-zinc-cadmium efflux system protein